MSRHAQVVTVQEPTRGRPGASWLRWPVTATATLAWAECHCGVTLATVVRPWETSREVVDAMLRAAGWCVARDLCPNCLAKRGDGEPCP